MLCPLDLAVPVGAFHQANRQAAFRRAAERDQPLAHRERALLVGLDGKTKIFRTGKKRFEDIKSQFQPLGLLGVDGHADATSRSKVCYLIQFW